MEGRKINGEPASSLKVGTTTHLAQILFRPCSFSNNHEQSGEKDNETMSNVTEHDREQERERDHSEESRVDLLIRRDTVAVHNVLEPFGELVCAVESGWCLVRAQFM